MVGRIGQSAPLALKFVVGYIRAAYLLALGANSNIVDRSIRIVTGNPSQNQRDLPRDTLLDRVEVLRESNTLSWKSCQEGSLNLSDHRCSSQEVSKFILRLKDQDIKLKSQDIKSKIKIQDRKHAKGTSKEFLRTQGSKIQDVTRSEAIIPMTTP
ncbi:hypothetical protein Tco_0990324 [Tanacetum coccineum]|uniref:Uncharacterized protein n=1 Tax=Tanacetum coccineum TaxID=301880 RepID=A0ABQ5EWE4_9ASTR